MSKLNISCESPNAFTNSGSVGVRKDKNESGAILKKVVSSCIIKESRTGQKRKPFVLKNRVYSGFEVELKLKSVLPKKPISIFQIKS